MDEDIQTLKRRRGLKVIGPFPLRSILCRQGFDHRQSQDNSTRRRNRLAVTTIRWNTMPRSKKHLAIELLQFVPRNFWRAPTERAVGINFIARAVEAVKKNAEPNAALTNCEYQTDNAYTLERDEARF